MLQNFFTVFGQVATLFIMMGVGFLFGKRGKLSRDTLSQMSFLLLYIANPCVIINGFQVESSPALIRELGQGALIMVLCYVIFIFITQLLFRRQSTDNRVSLRFGAVYGNIGFMGIPLIQSILGPDAMIYGALSLAVFSVATWTHGAVLMGGKEFFSLKKVILNPGIIGLIISLILFLFQIQLPSPVGNAVSFLANLNTPLAMVVIGGQMAASNLLEAFKRPILYAVSSVKLVVIPAIALLLLLPFKLSPDLYCASVILWAVPTAGITSMFAQQFGRDTTTAAQTITLSTLLSIITLPLFAALAKSIALPI